MHFCYFLIKIFKVFSNVYKTIVFRPNVRKIKGGFVNFLWKNRLKLWIYYNFLKNFLNFRKFSGVQGASPQDPILGRAPKMFPPPSNRNPGGAAVMSESSLSTVSEMKCVKFIPEFGFPDFRGLDQIKRKCCKIMLLAQNFFVPYKIQGLQWNISRLRL